uniref:G-protein coupled receptors family 1 profile domain-containing protein n=1 Tax=Amphiprion percula TaxID=161767 RepID=A0A3P8T160_AMPPE
SLRLKPAGSHGDRPGRMGADGAHAMTMFVQSRIHPDLCVCVLSNLCAGNILVIVIVAVTKTFHSVTSVLIMNLAISDLLVGIGVMPFVALSIMNHRWMDCTVGQLSSDLCLYVGYTSSVYCTASVLTLAAIALDRYHSIIDCLRYSSRCTLWRICAVVLWIWLQALATSSPPLLGWSSISFVVPMYSCAVNWASSPSYTAFMAALSYLIPAVVILFCYVNIVKVARSHARRIHTLEDSVQRILSTLLFQVLLQMLRLFLVISAFFLCWTPYIGVALIQATETAISGQSNLVPASVVTFSYWLVLLNSDINPLLYALLSKRFQNALQGLRQKIRARMGRVVGREGEVRAEGDEGRSSDPCTLTTTNPSPPSSLESVTSDNSKYSSSIFTVSTDFKHHSDENLWKENGSLVLLHQRFQD